MKRTVLCCIAIIAVLVSCKNNTHINSFLTASNLKSSFISLNADSAYVLKTPKGAVLRIAKNTFDVSAGTKVKLEIKEAYSIQDILLAGLSTTSNGKLLKSGGMIYINATANDKALNFLKPVNISIPTKAYDDSMQLFKGEIKDDSSINWIDPQPLDSSLIAKNLSMGKWLFKANCASCHKATEDFTGPALAGSRDREPSKDWVYKWMYNVNSMVMSDPYAISLKNKFGSVMTMQTERNLTKKDVAAILDWADNEARLKGWTDTNFAAKSAPCGDDTFYYPKPDTSIQSFSSNDNDSLPSDSAILNTTWQNENAEYSKKGFKLATPDNGTYQFDISEPGWYNIDCYIEAYKDITTPVKLTATLNMPEEFDMHVYLAVPQRTLLTNANYNNGKTYIFYNADSTVPLILKDEAIVFAVGSYKDKTYYGITRFTVKPEQNIIINIKESSIDDILKAIQKNELDSIKIDFFKQEMNIQKRPCYERDTAIAIQVFKQNAQVGNISDYTDDSNRIEKSY